MNIQEPNNQIQSVADYIRGLDNESLANYLLDFYCLGRVMERVNLRKFTKDDMLEFLIQRLESGDVSLKDT